MSLADGGILELGPKGIEIGDSEFNLTGCNITLEAGRCFLTGVFSGIVDYKLQYLRPKGDDREPNGEKIEIRAGDWLSCEDKHYLVEAGEKGELNLVPDSLVDLNKMIPEDLTIGRRGLILCSAHQTGEQRDRKKKYVEINHPAMMGLLKEIDFKELQEGQLIDIYSLPIKLRVGAKLSGLPWEQEFSLEVVRKENAPVLEAQPVEEQPTKPSPADAFWKIADEFIAEGEKGQLLEEPSVLVAPERKKKKEKFNWNVSMKEAMEQLAGKVGESKYFHNFVDFSEDLDKNPFNFKDIKKIRTFRDIAMISLAAVSDVVPMLRSTLLLLNAGTILGTGAAGFVDKARQIKKIKKERVGDLKKLGLKQEDIDDSESILKLAAKSFWNDSIFGKLSGGNKNIALNRSEKFLAAGGGAVLALASITFSEVTREIIGWPVAKTLAGRLVSRFMMQKIAPWIIIQGSSLVGRGMETVVSGRTNLETKRQDFVDVALSSMSATSAMFMPLMMIANGVATSGHNHQPEATITQTATATATAAAVLPSVTPEVTHTLEATITPTETPPAVAWELGQPVTHDVLESAVTAHHGWGVDTSEIPDGQADFQVFWLDDKLGPDVVIDSSGNHFIVGQNGFFYLDANNNHQIDNTPEYSETHVAWSLQDLGGETLKDLGNLSQDQVTDLLQWDSHAVPITVDQIMGPADLKVQAAPVSPEAQAEGLPPPTQIDLNGDDKMDILTDEHGKFSDVNYDGHFTQGVDTRITQLELSGIGTQTITVNLMKFDDGTRWEMVDGQLKGFLSDGRTLDIHSGGQLSILQKDLHELNLAWSPQRVGAEAFRHQGLSAAEIQPTPALPHQGTVTWEQLIKDERGGQIGVIQGQLWNEGNSNLSAQQAGAAAYIAVVNGHPTGPEMIADVNSSICRFSLEDTFRENMDKYSIIHGSPQEWALAAMRDQQTIKWSFPSDNIYRGPINQESLSIFTSYTDWEQWLRDHGYIN